MFAGDIGMATDAVVGPMRGQFQFGGLHKQGNCLAGGISFEESVVAMAIKAIAVFHPGHGRFDRQKQQYEQKRKTTLHTVFSENATRNTPLGLPTIPPILKLIFAFAFAAILSDPFALGLTLAMF